jgi:hypothetical protein
VGRRHRRRWPGAARARHRRRPAGRAAGGRRGGRRLEGWLRLTRRPAPALRPLGGAHPGAVSIRVDRTRAALTGGSGRQRFPYPRGTTIVKVVTLRGNLSMVALMRKVARGQAPASWRYAEYARGREGAFARVAGGQSLCRGCHVSARDEQRSDWVFSRLGPS